MKAVSYRDYKGAPVELLRSIRLRLHIESMLDKSRARDLWCLRKLIHCGAEVYYIAYK